MLHVRMLFYCEIQPFMIDFKLKCNHVRTIDCKTPAPLPSGPPSIIHHNLAEKWISDLIETTLHSANASALEKISDQLGQTMINLQLPPTTPPAKCCT